MKSTTNHNYNNNSKNAPTATIECKKLQYNC